MTSFAAACISVLVYILTLLFLPFCMLPAFIKHHLNLWIYGERGDKLVNTLDSLFLVEPVKISTVNWMVEVEGGLSVEELQKDLLEKCRQHCQELQKFCCVPVHEHGSTFWRKDPNFNIENHVKKLPTTANDEDHLKKILEENLLPISEDGIPLWKTLLINTEWGNTVLLFIVHHSITDGVGSMNLFNQLLTDMPGALPQRKTLQNKTCSKACGYATKFVSALEQLDSRENKFMKKGEIESTTDGKLEWSRPITMSELSRIRKPMGSVTINDVACGVILEAMARYLKHKKLPVPESKLRVEIPLSLRQAAEYTPMNSLSMIIAEMSLGDDNSVEQRIKHFSEQISAKKSVLPSLLFDIGRVVAYIASVRSSSMYEFSQRLTADTCVCISNIGGPRDVVKIAGRKVHRLVFIPTAFKQSGLTFTVGSYNGAVRLTIFDNIKVVDVELLMSLVNEVFEELLSHAANQGTE